MELTAIMSTLFKLSQTNFNAALPEYQSNLYMFSAKTRNYGKKYVTHVAV